MPGQHVPAWNITLLKKHGIGQAVVGVNMGDNLAPMGGVTALLVSVAFASSLGMSLPISTPPNALAYATGLVSSKGMAISGVILGILGMVLTYVMMMILAQCHAF